MLIRFRPGVWPPFSVISCGFLTDGEGEGVFFVGLVHCLDDGWPAYEG